MPADKNPVFRKAVIPWYKSTSAYIIMIIFMLLVFFFALTGISVAREYPEYQGYVWVPTVLLATSAGIIITTTARLFKRYSHKSAR
jgi:ABC-type transport system involved in cytochrome bd biosynthesis fused ATPase/permease subunit